MPFLRPSVAARFLAGLVVSVLSAVAADPAATGTVTGRVLNPATGAYLASAEVRLVGTDLLTVTEPDGFYRITQVPPGAHTVRASYTGLKAATATVEVRAGETATRDLELTAATDPAAGPVHRLDAFVIRSEREGNAKAIMEQRRSMNLTNSLSSDFFGDVAEGSVGEFLKNVPGVDVDYVGPDARGPRLRGLDPQYVGVTVDGMNFASADGLQATGGGARSFSFDQVSVNSVDRIEVNYTTSADQNADAPAGTINLKTKRAFERKGRRLSWQAHVMANGSDFTPRRTYGPGDTHAYKFRPGGILEYADVLLGNRLGLVLNISESSQYVAMTRVDHTYNATPTAADPRPRVITGVTFLANPRLTERFTPTLTLDYRATPSLVLSLTAMYNLFDAYIDQRQLVFTTPGGRSAITGDGLNGFSVINGGGSLNLTLNHSHKFVQTRTVSPKFEYRRGSWQVNGAFLYTVSSNQYVALPRVGPVSLTTNALTGLSWQLQRSSLRDPDWQVRQTGGRDISDLANFTNPRFGDTATFAENELWQGQVDARWAPGWQLPTWIKFGAKVTEDARRYRTPNAFLSWRYDGPGGGTTGSFAPFAFSENPWQVFNGANVSSLSGVPPTFPNRKAISNLFRERPEYFTNLGTAANFYTAFIDSPSYVTETRLASYAMVNTRIRQLQVQAGLRWEENNFASREFDALSTAEVRAAGFPVSTSTGRATTIPGLTYQYMSRPKTTVRSEYDNFFPSASIKYTVAENLQAHLGYSSTISRPALSNLGGVWVFNEDNQTVTVPNPNLQPERSKNLTGRVGYYFEPVGSAAVTLFQNEVYNSVTTEEFGAEDFGYQDDPTYSTYRFISVGNREGTTRVRGLTLEYSQALSFLPGALKGLNISANYTRTYASVRKAALTPHMIGGTLSYRYRRFALSTSGKWTDTTPMNTAAVPTYRLRRTMIDLNGSYQLTNRFSVFLQVRNLFNIPEYRYQIDPMYLTQHLSVGTFYTFGIKGVF
ncbi:MAG: TonB-dependent receptor [Verrucomicrobia bacterium]|nr:TonB-dependent receptor [Verrucomicrobiota bacterium]